MEKEKSYFDLLLYRSEEENALEKEVKKEREAFEQSDAYKAHDEKMKELYKKMYDARNKRLEEAKDERVRFSLKRKKDKVLPTVDEARERAEKNYNALPEDLRKAIELYKSLTDNEKEIFSKATWGYHFRNDDVKEGEITTKQDISDLQHILVQTVIDFANERGLKDLYSVGFGVDDIQASTEFGEWTCYSDSHIRACSTEYDGNIPVTKCIAEIF